MTIFRWPLTWLILIASLSLATPTSAEPPMKYRWPLLAGMECETCEIMDVAREHIADDIYHYQVDMEVGPGPFDRLRIHRVVREVEEFVPARSRNAIMLTHGSRTGFTGTFLSTVGLAELDPSANLAMYLARHGIDVWGFDMRWVNTSATEPNLDEVVDWGMGQDAADLDTALSIARQARRSQGSSHRRMALLGYSWGGRVGYAFLNQEVQKPRGQRHVNRYIALEGLFKTADEARRQEACRLIDVLQGRLDDGIVASDNRPLAFVGGAALLDPDGPSAQVPGLTNRQAALVFSSRAALAGLVPLHGFAADFVGPLPVGLRFTEESAAFNFFASSSGIQPIAGVRDLMIVLCDDGRSDLDDRLAEVDVPVLYLGAAGGFAENGLDTFPFLGSRHLVSSVVRFESPDDVAIDVGHGDILMMDDAAELVWEPIADWVRGRSAVPWR